MKMYAAGTHCMDMHALMMTSCDQTTVGVVVPIAYIISPRVMCVQVLRRGHGLLIEVIDVGMLSDVVLIGAMQIMPANEDKWLPPVDGFFDLLKIPQGGAAMRPWYQTFEGVPVIDLCLQHTPTSAIPLQPTPPALQAFVGVNIDCPPPFNPHCARHDVAAWSQVFGSTVDAMAGSQIAASTLDTYSVVVAEVAGSTVQGQPLPTPPRNPPPTLDIKVGPPQQSVITQTQVAPTQRIQAKAPPFILQVQGPPSVVPTEGLLGVKKRASNMSTRMPKIDEEEDSGAAIMNVQTFHIDLFMFGRAEWTPAAFLQTLSDGTPVPGGNGAAMNGFALGLSRNGETMMYEHVYAPREWVTASQVARANVLHDAIMKLAHVFDAAVETHGDVLHGALYGFHAVRAWLVNIGLRQVVMGPMAAALAKQNILPNRQQSGTWSWVSGPGGTPVNMIAHVVDCFDLVEDKLMKCGAALQLNIQPLQAPPVDAIDPEIAEQNDHVLRTAFPMRNLLMSPVMQRPRRGLCVMVAGHAVRGHMVLAVQPCLELNVNLLGLDLEAESWWVVSHGHWHPRAAIESASCRIVGMPR